MLAVAGRATTRLQSILLLQGLKMVRVESQKERFKDISSEVKRRDLNSGV